MRDEVLHLRRGMAKQLGSMILWGTGVWQKNSEINKLAKLGFVRQLLTNLLLKIIFLSPLLQVLVFREELHFEHSLRKREKPLKYLKL